MKLILFIFYTVICFTSSIGQNTFFEKAFQDDWSQFNRSFFKTTNGALCYYSHKGVINGPFLSMSKLIRINNEGEILSKTNIPRHIPDAEEIYFFDFVEMSDGQILATTRQMGCDYGIQDACSLVKISTNGEYSVIRDFEGNSDNIRLIKYKNTCIIYWLEYVNASYIIKWEIINDNFESTELNTLQNYSFEKIISNANNELYAFERVNFTGLRIHQIDTLGNSILQSPLIQFPYVSTFDMETITTDSSIFFTVFDKLVKINKSLDQYSIFNFNGRIHSLSKDRRGNLYVLSESQNMLKINSSDTIVYSINLKNLTPKAEFVEWISVEDSLNTLFYGGGLNNHPFIKTVRLSDFAQNENQLSTQIEDVQISNSYANVQSGSMSSSINYGFDVTATIRNTGNTVIDSLFLNCSRQIGFYFCGGPYLAKKYTNLNLNPNESARLFIGNYLDYNITGPPNITSYTRENFCVWSSNQNGTWTYFDDSFCNDVLITNIINSIPNVNSSIYGHLYPNPAQEFINFELDNQSQITNYKVVDLNGRTLIEKSISEQNTVQVNVSDLPKGMYILILTSNSDSHRVKFVKD